MIPYKHFAIPNLFLVNGYEEIQTQDGIEREYYQEDELEQCVRCLLLRSPQPLRGWDLRFLRNGLGLSQAEFGQMVDRDAQTIARWEKSPDPVPKFADMIIRIRFAGRFEPRLGTRDVLSFTDGTARPLPMMITLTLDEKGWNFNLDSIIKLARTQTRRDIIADLPPGSGPILKFYEKQGSMEASPPQSDQPHTVSTWHLLDISGVSPPQSDQPYTVSASNQFYILHKGALTGSPNDTFTPLPLQGNIDAHTPRRHLH